MYVSLCICFATFECNIRRRQVTITCIHSIIIISDMYAYASMYTTHVICIHKNNVYVHQFCTPITAYIPAYPNTQVRTNTHRHTHICTHD